MHHLMRGLLTTKKLFSSAPAERRKKEQDYYLKNGSAVLEELLALCDGNCRIPIRYFNATEIERAIKHSEKKIGLDDGYIVTCSLNNRLVLIRFSLHPYGVHRDIAITTQMSHLKNVLRLIGCCLEFESPVMVYEYVEGIFLDELLSNRGNHDDQNRKSLLSWGSRLRIANEIASAIVFFHTEFTTPIIHRDIKPDKVIIDQNSGVAKIVDFSFSISLPSGEWEVQKAVCGTIEYLDPEYGYCGIITQKTDVYSFGVELLTGKEVCDIMESNIREDNAMNRERFCNFKRDIYFDIEEGNIIVRVDSTISEEKIDYENLPSNLVDHIIEEGNVMNITDPVILEEYGIEIRQQLEEYSWSKLNVHFNTLR